MPRANRHFLPGQLWHLTHCCHEKAFLLKFARDRRRYLRCESKGPGSNYKKSSLAPFIFCLLFFEPGPFYF